MSALSDLKIKIFRQMLFGAQNHKNIKRPHFRNLILHTIASSYR